MKILFIRPDIFVSLRVVVASFVGGALAIGASFWFFFGSGPKCDVLPLFSASGALLAVLPWSLRRTGHFGGKRFAALCVVFAVLTASAWIYCRVFLLKTW